MANTFEIVQFLAPTSDPNLVPCGAQKIGPVGSGADYESNAYHEFYLWLWPQHVTYGLAIKSGVYGANAEADWSAGKWIQTIGITDQAYAQLDSDYDKITSLQSAVTALQTARSFTNPTRSLNTAFQPSTTRDAAVSYSVDVSTTLSLSGGQTGTVYLRYADDSAHTTNVKEVARFANGNTGTLTIGLNITQTNTGTLSGLIPAGKYAKLVTENNTGTPGFTYRSAQEVLL